MKINSMFLSLDILRAVSQFWSTRQSALEKLSLGMMLALKNLPRRKFGWFEIIVFLVTFIIIASIQLNYTNYNNNRNRMQGKLISIYEKLYSEFGPRKWWPTTIEGEALPSYNGRKPDDKGRFEIAVGAILTQNTAWDNVVKAISGLNSLSLLSSEAILSSDKEILKGAIRPSGYYNQKYKKLIALSSWWLENYGGVELGSAEDAYIEETRNALLSINGIGPETADSILLYAFEMPSFVIDTYTKRIMSRHFGVDPAIKYEALRSMFMAELPRSAELYKEYHALLVELAKNHCRKGECRKTCIFNGSPA